MGQFTRLRLENLLLLALTAVTVVGGYLFFRIAYHISENLPFAQEILLVGLGTLVTVLITALLLNKQTLVELQKEQNLRYFELKARTFEQLFDRVERFISERRLTDRDLIALWFVTHRLAVVASPGVLEEYQRFLRVFNRVAGDRVLTGKDAQELSEALARLTVEIRKDLVGEEDLLSRYSPETIRRLVLANEAEATTIELRDQT